jgi:hypothetical protein
MLQYKDKSNDISKYTSNDTSNIDMPENIIRWNEYPMVSILDLCTSQYHNINVSE